MKTTKSLPAVASVAKGKRFALATLVSVFLFAGPKVQGSDIFATPTPKDTTSIPYPTAAAIVAAAKTGEIPEFLQNNAYYTYPKNSDSRQQIEAFERSLRQVMEKEWGLLQDGKDDHYFVGYCMDAFTSISVFELNRNHAERAAELLRKDRNYIKGSATARAFEAFDSTLKEYSKAVKAYAIQRQEQAEQKQVAEERERQKEEIAERQAQAAREQESQERKAVEDARRASIAAEEAIKAGAIKSARIAQQEDRAKKLDECLSSLAYKIWEASVKVATGVELIRNAQGILDHDNAVARESEVSDLAQRRRAGEDIVAGKMLVEEAFADYKKLGGTASTPEEVVPGPDPAAQYR